MLKLIKEVYKVGGELKLELDDSGLVLILSLVFGLN